MSRNNDIGSGFENLPDGEGSVVPVGDDGDAKRGIDFARARLLSTEGANCDTYLVTRSNKLLLVKRLKEEHRFKPRHRSAIAKEFELGYRLRHSNLPVYLDCGEDYLVMDYVEGDTLRKLIANDVKFLHKPENLRRIFEQLIDVVDYLHHENVTHCDIKADNVMLTRRTHNVMLIDLGNAYADWHPMTAGKPSVYGVNDSQKGSTDIDFHGVGRIADTLTEAGFNTRALQRFRALCDKPGITAEQLLESLKIRKHRWQYVAIAVVLACVIGALFGTRSTQHRGTATPHDTTLRTDTIIIREVPVENASSPTDNAPSVEKIPGFRSTINSEMASRLQPLESQLTIADEIMANPEATDAELRNTLYTLMSLKSRLTQDSYAHFQERFPDIPAIDVQMAVVNSPSYQQLSKRLAALSNTVSDRLEGQP